MVICPKCNSAMRHVFRFTPDQNLELDICRNCYYETKPKKMKFEKQEARQNKSERKKKGSNIKNVKKSRSKFRVK